jgi:hypothetical protein
MARRVFSYPFTLGLLLSAVHAGRLSKFFLAENERVIERAEYWKGLYAKYRPLLEEASRSSAGVEWLIGDLGAI